MKKLLTVTFHFIFPLRHILRDPFGSLVVFMLLFLTMGGWKLVPMSIWREIGNAITVDEEARAYGQVYDVSKFHWAQIMNRYGVRTKEFSLRRFEYCLIRQQGSVQEITNHTTWWSDWKSQVLVEYTIPEGLKATGTLCPSGTIYYIPKKELVSVPGHFRIRKLLEWEIHQEGSAAPER